MLLAGCNCLVVPPDGQGKVTLNLVLPAGITSQGQTAAVIPGEYIVTFESSAALRKLRSTAVVSSSESTTQALMRAKSMTELQALPGVLRVQPNYRYEKLAVPDDPYWQNPFVPSNPQSAQWYLDQIGATGAWNDTGTTTTTRVAVLDDGYTHHEDLSLSSLDLQPIGCNTDTGEHCLNPALQNDDPYYQEPFGTSHGMSLVGLIAATTNNTTGVASLNFNGNKQSPIKVIPIGIYTPEGGSSTDIIAKGIRTAIAKGAKVINLSLCISSGGVCSSIVSDPVLDQVLKEAHDAGVVVTVSAGNNGKNFVAYPANSVHVLSVGATDVNQQKSSFSHYGGHLRLVAPGEDLLMLMGSFDEARSLQTTYHQSSGTSFSSPLAAAAAGLLFSKRPDATWNQVVGALLHSGDTLSDPRLPDVKFLRIDKALAEINGDPPAPPALRGTYQAEVTVSGTTVESPVVFDFQASLVNVLSSQTLDSGVHTVHAVIRDGYQPGKTIFTCDGTFTVVKNETITRDLQCK
ncbi:hypothetical protein GCM10008938_00480 [Deinococcus roseus]|uniref:Peptidase S8/S53 domain-containing protein n=2 Tax=Deinococcus roseus TaxID=392414 RepID=A0ABQ2CT24_9DEIO|nr:hypothetical protein GCM10008938_00480 [Deinococcus roseus]